MKRKTKILVGSTLILALITVVLINKNWPFFKGSFQAPIYQAPFTSPEAGFNNGEPEDTTCGGDSCQVRQIDTEQCEKDYISKQRACASVGKSCTDSAKKKSGTQAMKLISKCKKDKAGCDNKSRGETLCCFNNTSVCCSNPTSDECQEEAVGAGL